MQSLLQFPTQTPRPSTKRPNKVPANPSPVAVMAAVEVVEVVEFFFQVAVVVVAAAGHPPAKHPLGKPR